MHTCRNQGGVTIVELVVTLLIASLVIIGVYEIQQDVSVKADRESNKALLQKDITTAAQLIEKDIRSAGFGVPGNGIALTNDSSGNSQLQILVNFDNAKARLTSAIAAASTKVPVVKPSGVVAGMWVCVPSGSSYNFVKVIEKKTGTADTLVLQNSAGAALPSGTVLGCARGMKYYTANGSLFKENNSSISPVCGNITKLQFAAIDSSGAVLAGPVTSAVSIRVTLGGSVGKGKAIYSTEETTQVYIRNAGS